MKLSLAAIPIFITLMACTIQGAEPTPTPTPTPDLTSVTAQDVIGWLREAGLVVEVLERDEDHQRSSYGSTHASLETARTRLSVDGHDRVWIYEVDPPWTPDDLHCQLCDYAAESYPNFFVLGDTSVVVQGVERDIIEKIYTALWDKAPSNRLAPYGLFPLHNLERGEATDQAVQWLVDQGHLEEDHRSAARPEAAIVKISAVVEHLPDLRAVQETLPHPDSLVWAVQTDGDSEEQPYNVVLIDFLTGIVVAQGHSQQRLPLDDLARVPSPRPIRLTATDGQENEHDELATVVNWTIPEPSVGMESPDLLLEDVQEYLLERATSPEGPWESVRVWEGEYRSGSGEQQYVLTPPYGRARQSGPPNAELRYWDWDVEAGQTYYYRVSGCTTLGRPTEYSNIASAVAGDPNPTTPHPHTPLPSADYETPSLECTGR